MDKINSFQKHILDVLNNHRHPSAYGESEIQHVTQYRLKK